MTAVVTVVAVEDVETAAPIEAILVRRGDKDLIRWWGGYAWEGLEINDLDLVVDQNPLQKFEMELPKDWEEGYLVANEGTISFTYGSPPPRDE